MKNSDYIDKDQDTKEQFETLHNEVEENKNEDNPLNLNPEKGPIDSDGHGPYIPGSQTDPDQRHDNYEVLVKDTVEKLHGPQEDRTEKFWRKVAEGANRDEINQQNMKFSKKSDTPKLPYVNVSQNFNFAKKMHSGNLEHEPLPDTLGYRNLTKVGEHRGSDIIVKPYAIGWKGYGASGPTCCTKMRVHRPKTCDPKKSDEKPDDRKQRPATGLDLGGQYKKPLSLMDLAICWDFKTDNPKTEPKPPKHIDGSKGSLAPAVFTMVNTPKEEVKETVLGHAYPIFNQNRDLDDVGRHNVPHFEKDMSKEKRKDVCDVQNCPQHNEMEKNVRSRSSSRKSSALSEQKSFCDGINGCGTISNASHNLKRENSKTKPIHVKEAWNSNNKNILKYDINRNRHSLESYEKTPLAQGKLHQSSPIVSQMLKHPKESTKSSETSESNIRHKTCSSCNGAKINEEKLKPKDEYKSAFKAGNPNSIQSSSTNDSKELKIPKMRHPYTKKSYTIPTLAPPFSIWRDANATGYPEHWRLASVYQHAYKPPEQRRKPLIESVFQ